MDLKSRVLALETENDQDEANIISLKERVAALEASMDTCCNKTTRRIWISFRYYFL